MSLKELLKLSDSVPAGEFYIYALDSEYRGQRQDDQPKYFARLPVPTHHGWIKRALRGGRWLVILMDFRDLPIRTHEVGRAIHPPN